APCGLLLSEGAVLHCRQGRVNASVPGRPIAQTCPSPRTARQDVFHVFHGTVPAMPPRMARSRATAGAPREPEGRGTVRVVEEECLELDVASAREIKVLRRWLGWVRPAGKAVSRLSLRQTVASANSYPRTAIAVTSSYLPSLPVDPTLFHHDYLPRSTARAFTRELRATYRCVLRLCTVDELYF